MREEDEIKTWENNRGDVVTPGDSKRSDEYVCVVDYLFDISLETLQFQETANDQMNMFVLSIIYLVSPWRRYSSRRQQTIR
jgi:hypothetical protein